MDKLTVWGALGVASQRISARYAVEDAAGVTGGNGATVGGFCRFYAPGEAPAAPVERKRVERKRVETLVRVGRRVWSLDDDPRFVLQRQRDATARRRSMASKITAPAAPRCLYANMSTAPLASASKTTAPAAPAGWVDVTAELKQELGIA